MSVNSYYDDVEAAAMYAVTSVGAVVVCRRHPEVTIRVGDEDRERHAYARATSLLKRDGTTWMREDVMPAIKDALDMAADGECPACGSVARA